MSPNRWRSSDAVEVDALVELVDDLPQQRAGLHVVVGILEGGADAAGGAAWLPLQVFEAGEEVVVDELHGARRR